MNKKEIFIGAIIIILFGFGVWYMKWQYDLCAENDLGLWYCLRHVGIL